jgi:hypothetical protein
MQLQMHPRRSKVTVRSFCKVTLFPFPFLYIQVLPHPFGPRTLRLCCPQRFLFAESCSSVAETERSEKNTARIALLEEALEEVTKNQTETNEKLTRVQKKQEAQRQQILKRQTTTQVKKLITATQSEQKDSEEEGDSIQEQIDRLTETTIALRADLTKLQEATSRRAAPPSASSSQGLQSSRSTNVVGPMVDNQEQLTDREQQLQRQLQQAERALNSMRMQSLMMGSPQPDPGPMLLDPVRYQSARTNVAQTYGSPLYLSNLGYGRPY